MRWHVSKRIKLQWLIPASQGGAWFDAGCECLGRRRKHAERFVRVPIHEDAEDETSGRARHIQHAHRI